MKRTLEKRRKNHAEVSPILDLEMLERQRLTDERKLAHDRKLASRPNAVQGREIDLSMDDHRWQELLSASASEIPAKTKNGDKPLDFGAELRKLQDKVSDLVRRHPDKRPCIMQALNESAKTPTRGR